MINERDTASEIREALSITGTTASTEAVKRAVRRSIRAVDASVSIETTDYFNHSYAPDLVLRWDRPSASDERFVFLRFNDEPGWIIEELPHLAPRHPVVYGLAPTREAEATETLARRSRETETLVTDPGGVDQLAQVPASGIASFVSRTLMRGGKGLVDEARAESATADITGGFEAARAADTERTKSAATAAVDFLRPLEAGHIVRFLQAMWVAGGAPVDSFPAETGTAADLGNEGLKFLIDHARR